MTWGLKHWISVINSELSRACPTEQNIFTIQTSKTVLFLFLQYGFDYMRWKSRNVLVTMLSDGPGEIRWWQTEYLSPPVGSVITGQIKCLSKSNQICWLCDYRLITFYQGDGYQSLLRGPAYPLRSQSCSVPYLSRGLPNLFSQEFGGITFHKTLTKWQVNDDISPALLW